MDADQLIQYVSWLTYILIFARVIVQAVRRPRRANIDIALFFSSTTVIIALNVLGRRGLLPSGDFWTRASGIISGTLLVALPYLLLRLLEGFSSVSASPVGASEN